MDLGSFLPPGADLPIKLMDETQANPVLGRLTEYRGRMIWFSSAPYTAGRRLVIYLKLPGFEFDNNDTLKRASNRLEAELNILAQVAACRYYQPKNQYILRLKLLGRILD